jgi:hypothetical protein
MCQKYQRRCPALLQLRLPPGYSLDLTHDPEVPHLRREDGYPIAVFGPGARREAVEQLAWADYRARAQRIACSKSEDLT